MKHFLETDLYVSQIEYALLVHRTNTKRLHVNRAHHGLCIRLEGTPSVTYTFSSGDAFTPPVGSIIFFPKGSSYTVDREPAHNPPPYICQAVNFQFCTDEVFSPCLIQSRHTNVLLEHFTTLSKMWSMRQPGYVTECLAHLYSIFKILRQEHLNTYIPRQKAQVLAPALAYIEEHFMQENIKIGTLADLCDISEVYFRKLFQSLYSLPPKQYIAQRRLNNAHSLLLSGDYSVAEVAEICGYSSDCYFSQAFKKTYGISPSLFRQQNQP